MKLTKRHARRAQARDRKRTIHLNLEQCEDRMLLATFTVTNNTDAGPGSLRQAILDSNATTGPNVINFNIKVGAIAESANLSASTIDSLNITSGGDGNLWFTEFDPNMIGRITPAGVYTAFPIPTPNSGSDGITTGSDNNVWFTESLTDKIGRITPTGTITEFALPAGSGPRGITSGNDGNLWFTESNNKIGEMSTAGVVLNQFTIPTTNSSPEGITAGPGMSLSFTEFGANQIGIVTNTGTFTEKLIPTTNSEPMGITLAGGNLWFTEMLGNKIGKMTPAGAFTEFPLSTPSSSPTSITVGSDTNLWFTEPGINSVGMIPTSGAPITEFPAPIANSQPEGITSGPDKNIWITQANNIGRVTVAAGLTISPLSQLPTITQTVLIDGTTEAGIVIDGGGLTQDGLVLGTNSGGSTVQGLTLQNFGGSAIRLKSGGNTVQEDVLGASGLGNQVGVLIDGSSNNTVGGASSTLANTVIANTVGVEISGAGAATNLVESNFIGTDTANDQFGNQVGVLILNSSQNTIGANNTIGYNAQQGISILSGIKNVVTGNLYVGANGPALPVQVNDIFLQAGANNNQPAPTIQTAYDSGGHLTLEVTGVPAGTIVEVYQATSPPPGQRSFLGAGTVTANGSLLQVTISGTVANGTQVLATATESANGTSAFSATQTAADLYKVVNNNPSGAGSLNQAIINANDHPGSNTITFALPAGSLTIQPTTAFPLPTITDPVVIDGTSQAGVIIDGNDLTQDGFLLGTGSGGSTIQGLTIQNFAGAAIRLRSGGNTVQEDVIGASGLGNQIGVMIDGGSSNTVGATSSALGNTIIANGVAGVEISGTAATANIVESNVIGASGLGNQVGVLIVNSSGNTVGGTGVGNTIGYNVNQGVSIVSGIQNVVSQNLYVDKNGTSLPVQSNDISLGAGANNNQAAPTLQTATLSAGNLVVQVSGVPVGALVELYQLVTTTTPPTRTFLGSAAVALVNGIPTVTIPAGSVGINAQIVATATVTANGTSAFSASQTVASLLVVTNNNASGTGSLFQAIVNANNSPGLDTITFDITSGSLVITPTVAFPLVVMGSPVFIDGNSEAGIVIDGGGASLDGILLGSGSGGSTIQGLTIRNFSGAAIHVLTNGNTIQQDVLTNSSMSNSQIGVLLDGGSNNTVGGASSGLANTITANGIAGVQISGATATANIVESNVIGASGLGNQVGVLIVNSSGNTIGGTGVGNTIGFNAQQGVSIVSGIQNVVSQNLYVDMNGTALPIQSNDISLGAGANNNQAAPTLLTATLANGNLVVQVSGVPVGALVELYQVNSGTTPTRTFLNSAAVALVNGIPTVTIPAGSVSNNSLIVATATVTANGTSAFSATQTVANPLVVTNNNASGTGSLFQAIVNANNTPGLDTITFNITSGSLVITPTVAFPLVVMGSPVIINGNSEAGIVIDGGGASLDGILLGSGSGGSTIEGLTIQNFAGAAIHVLTSGNTIQQDVLTNSSSSNSQIGVLLDGGSNNTVGGTSSGLANTITANGVAGVEISGTAATANIVESNVIGASGLGNQVGVLIVNSSGNTIGGAGVGNTIGFNKQQGVSIVSGIQNVVSQNLYDGTNGTALPIQSNDISLGAGANNNQAAPTLLNAAISGGNLVVQVSGIPAGADVELYQLTTGSPPTRTFLGSGAATSINGVLTVTIPAGSLGNGATIAGTATVLPANGTSPFSASQTIAALFVVTNNNPSGPGSLFQAIQNANLISPRPSPPISITFAISGSNVIIQPTLVFPLVLLNPMVIDGTNPGGGKIIIDGSGLSLDGFVLGPGSDGSTIENLTVQNFAGAGIHVLTDQNTIRNDTLGTATAPNQLGVWIDAGSNNTVGGTSAASDTIQGNTVAGVQISGAGTGNLVEGNLIGATSMMTPTAGNLVGVLIINSSGNTIGGAGAGNTIGFNTQLGVSVVSGINNVISQNLYVGTNGPAGPNGMPPLVESFDIALGQGGNNNLAPPTIQSANIVGTQLISQVAGVSAGTIVEVYQLSASPQERIFVGSAPAVTVGNVLTVTINAGTLKQNDVLVATATDTTNGTSPFSAEQTVQSPLVVTVNSDNGDDNNPLPGSLRAAIKFANANSGSTITFDIGEGGFQSIVLVNNPLPAIVVPTTIDGTTQPGYANQPVAAPFAPLLPFIQVRDSEFVGDSQFFSGDGLVLGPNSGGSAIKGLDIVNFTGAVGNAGIHIESNGNVISADWAGVDSAPFDVYGYLGNYDGIFVDNATGNTIGLPGISGRNLISGNNNDAVVIQGGGSNLVQNAYVGADFFGNLITDQFLSFNLYNVGNGINIDGSSSNTIGAPIGNNDAFNVISGNFGDGIIVQGVITSGVSSAAGNIILNNRIGTDATGELSNEFMGNLGDGIHIKQASGTKVGLDSATPPNYAPDVISGNFGNGIEIDGSTMTSVNGNFIGTDALGLTSNSELANNLNGILIKGSTHTTVGGLTAADSNVISGNIKAGIRIDDSATMSPLGKNLIEGNKIGTTSTGNSDLGNGSDGIDIINSPDNTVGGTAAGSQNLITGNNGNGVLIAGASNIVEGNVIGARTANSQTLGNAFNGISLINAANNTIGGSTSSGAGNVITANGFGSFARTQLNTTQRQTNPNDIHTYTLNSFSTIAAGSFSRNDSFLGMVGAQFETGLVFDPVQQIYKLVTQPTGAYYLVLFESDATGANTQTETYNLNTNLGLPNPVPLNEQYEFSLYSGNFFGTTNSDGTRIDDLLLIMSIADMNGNLIPGSPTTAYLLQLDTSKPVPKINSSITPQPIPLDGLPLSNPVAPSAAIGNILAGGATGFVVAEQQANGSPVLVTYRPQLNTTSMTTSAVALQTINVSGSISDVITADFHGTGLDDIAIANKANKAVDVFTNVNGTIQTSPIVFSTSAYGITPTSIGAGQLDVNLLTDPHPTAIDLVVVDGVQQTATVFMGNNDGTFTPFQSPPAQYHLQSNPTTVVVADFEGTGVNDIAVLDSGNSSTPGQVTLLSGNGDGTFRIPTNFDVGLNPTGMVPQLIPGFSSPTLAVGNALTTSQISTPTQLQVNLRQLSARRSNGVAITAESDGNAIEGNLIGVDVSGNEARPNATDGVFIDASGVTRTTGNTIGGSVAGLANIISGNNSDGVHLQSAGSTAPGVADWIQGNIIGLDQSGQTSVDTLGRSLGNGKNGVELGGLEAIVSGNVISGNGINGIAIGRYQGVLNSSPTVAATIIGNVIGLNKDANAAFTPDGQFPLGNVLNGISVDNVVGVVIGGTTNADLNVISGNLGRGIQIVEDRLVSGPSYAPNSILGNLIGIGVQNYPVTNQSMALANQTVAGKTLSLGNLSDGIFLLDDKYSATEIGPQSPSSSYSVISNNRGVGIHTFGSTNFTIQNNIVGLSFPQNNVQTAMGNIADGILLDTVAATPAGGAQPVSVSDNVISGNRQDGLGLVDATNVTVFGNTIGLASSVISATSGFGNAGNGITVNTSSSGASSSNLIGGTTPAARNVVSGNQTYGIAIVGASDSLNQIAGNYVGVSADGMTAVQNNVSGIIIVGSSMNTVGGSVAGAGNLVSGNGLYGIQIDAGSNDNSVWGNFVGTDQTGLNPLPNQSDGVLIANATSNQIGGTAPNESNVISGNDANGVRIFGSLATGNQVAGNDIGLGKDGETKVGNLANGVLLDNAGSNTVGAGNVISENRQAGVMIISSTGMGGSYVQGNKIGTDVTGELAEGNAGNGVFIYGSSGNVIGGVGAGLGNLISANAQAGVAIFSPASGAMAQNNLVEGNKIGTDATGLSSTGSNGSPLGNSSDGVDIFSGQLNVIGSVQAINVISGNQGNGVLITTVSSVPAVQNTLAGNYIGVGADGATSIPNKQNGVLVQNASNNSIGVASGNTLPGTNVPSTPVNVISANGVGGIEFDGYSQGNAVEGNYIGVDRTGNTVVQPTQSYGVFIDNQATQPTFDSIGGTAGGAGNIISGSTGGNGIEILGSEFAQGYNLVEGNLIGVGAQIGDVVGNANGIAILNSFGNTIGGPSSLSAMETGGLAATGNVISGNSQSGILISGLYATNNVVQGNYIGPDISGNGRINKDANTPWVQTNGVFIIGADNNTIGAGNVISGNEIGVNITGTGTSGANGQTFGSEVVAGNLIGINYTGTSALFNVEFGVFLDSSVHNTIGGTTAGAGNIISANGIDGVEIIGGRRQQAGSSSQNAAAQFNVVEGNVIGLDANHQASFVMPNTSAVPQFKTEDGPTVFLGYQLFGVAVIGSSRNAIGGTVASAGNAIGGNLQVGVYISRQDFLGNVYTQPINNKTSYNQITSDGIYGVLRFNAPGNPAPQGRQRFANTFSGNRINVGDYITSVNSKTKIPSPPSLNLPPPQRQTPSGRPRHKVTVKRHAVKAAVARPLAALHKSPKIPALFEPGVHTKQVPHTASRRRG
jgi:streptogramin lyase